MRELQVGDLVTVWTGGWDKRMRQLLEGRAGIITRIEHPEFPSYIKCYVNFGWGDIEISDSRLRLLAGEKD